MRCASKPRAAQVIGRCECGCATIDLETAPNSPLASEIECVPAVEAHARDMAKHPVELLLFVYDGRLSSLEIVWYDERQKADTVPSHDFWQMPTACGT